MKLLLWRKHLKLSASSQTSSIYTSIPSIQSPKSPNMLSFGMSWSMTSIVEGVMKIEGHLSSMRSTIMWDIPNRGFPGGSFEVGGRLQTHLSKTPSFADRLAIVSLGCPSTNFENLWTKILQQKHTQKTQAPRYSRKSCDLFIACDLQCISFAIKTFPSFVIDELVVEDWGIPPNLCDQWIGSHDLGTWGILLY